MKKKVKSINLKQATMVAFAATMIMANITNSLQPVEAAYRTPMEYNISTIDGDPSNDIDYSYYQKETWFKAIYPNWNGDANNQDLIDFYENIFKGKTIPSSEYTDIYSKWGFISKHMTDPLHDYSKMLKEYHPGTPDNKLFVFFQNLDPSKQYFPTLEFKVGSDIAYVDGKQFKLESPVIKSKEGKVLIPMGHLSTILESGDFGFNRGLEYEAAAGNAQLVSPIFTPQFQGYKVINGEILEAVKIRYNINRVGPSYTEWAFDAEPIKSDSKLNGATQINNTLYVPAQYLAQYTNSGKAIWDGKKQTAKINGQYTPEAVPYGIFKKPGTSTEYNIFKDWEMVPQQPVASKY